MSFDGNLFEYMDGEKPKKKVAITIRCNKCGSKEIMPTRKSKKGEIEYMGLRCTDCNARDSIPLRLWKKTNQFLLAKQKRKEKRKQKRLVK